MKRRKDRRKRFNNIIYKWARLSSRILILSFDCDNINHFLILNHYSEAPGKTFEECIILSKKVNSPESTQYSPSRRGRSPDRRIRSRSPDLRIFGRSPDRRRSPFHKKGSTVKSWRNQSQSPEGSQSFCKANFKTLLRKLKIFSWVQSCIHAQTKVSLPSPHTKMQNSCKTYI